MNSAQVFISYSSADRTFANRLQADLVNIGLSVWKDDKDIKPGDSFSSKIEQAIITSDFFFLILSASSVSSPWVEKEYRLALHCQIENGKPCVIPILLHSVEPPHFLFETQHADFRKNYTAGWAEVSKLFPLSELRALRIGGGTGTGNYLLKRFVARFRERFPDLPIQKRVDISEELIRAVASERIDTSLDVAVVGKIPAGNFRRSLEYQEVFRDVSVLMVFPEHPLWGAESISEDVMLSLLREDMNFISRPKGSGLYEAVMNYLEPRLGKSETDILLSRFVAYDLESVKRLVSEGHGISIMPKLIVNEEVSSGKMWAVNLPGDVYRPFYGVWARDCRRSPVAEDFIALLKEGVGAA
ncbi:MAG TPA: LysR substrate-binding domain-containing protein [Pyrinomonadaceae bacterium]|jgi:DNA-binding transcriptional LysR family regulator|nr:LysR substrate-binding domain-containing protein [Pyrinomonadaceae bacterium]